jgi:hypothetical protein
MKKVLFISASIITLLMTTTLVIGDDDRYENEEHEKREGHSFFNRITVSRLDVAPVNNKTYQEECGSCHFAYQPGLLPARSWEKLMGDLENHFDENAELDKPVQTELTKYLVINAADQAKFKRSRAIINSLGKNDVPLRITETPYFIRKHDEIPRRMVQDNPKLGSFSKCAACHSNAKKGSYDEHQVVIPGVGKWED